MKNEMGVNTVFIGLIQSICVPFRRRRLYRLLKDKDVLLLMRRAYIEGELVGEQASEATSFEYLVQSLKTQYY